MQDQQLSTFLLLFDAGSLCSFGACPGQAWTKRGQFTEGGGCVGGDRCSSTSQENRCPRSRETGTTLNVPEPGQDCDGLRTPATPNREATREEGSRGLRYPTELSVISQLRG